MGRNFIQHFSKAVEWKLFVLYRVNFIIVASALTRPGKRIIMKKMYFFTLVDGASFGKNKITRCVVVLQGKR